MKKVEFEKNQKRKIIFNIPIFNVKKIKINKANLTIFIIEYIVLIIPFLLMDHYIREEAQKIHYKVDKTSSYIYSYIYIIFFFFSSKCLKGNIGKCYYSFLFILHFLLFLTHIIFFSFNSTFFQFRLLSYAGEGSHYIIDVILDLKAKIYIDIILIIISFIFTLITFRKSKKNNFPFLIIIIIIFILAQVYLKKKLFGSLKKKAWNDFDKPINILNEFSNSNKCMKIVGFYKFIQMDFYKTYINLELLLGNKRKEELEFLKNIYKDMKMHNKNKYTGIFKDKNIILIQLEGFEKYLLNEEHTPTFNSLKKNSFVFNDHYSFKINSGQTFNSEFCVNTGFYTPVTLTTHSYDLNKNTFYSLPKAFKKLGYISKAFHFNYPEFYSRDVNYLSWGYDKFLSLMKTKTKYKYFGYAGLDTELIKNKEFYDEIFNIEGKFLYYFITYSTHYPFANKPYSQTYFILKNKFGNNIPKKIPKDEINKIQAEETDAMIKLLIEGLKEHNLFNNTVIVFFSDHSSHGMRTRILAKYKVTSDQRINQTPFFIWSANIKGKNINKTNSQLDILPTILNLFGIPFQKKLMIGRDIFDKNNLGIAFFDDYSWIDGNILVNNGNVKKLKKIPDTEIDKNYISNRTEEVRERYKQNDLTIKYDYLKYILKN